MANPIMFKPVCKKKWCLINISLVALLLCDTGVAEELRDYHGSSQQSEEYNIGIMVKSIQSAIDHPEQHDSLTTIFEYGGDSRYYVMIRGWLTQELASAKSQQSAVKDTAAKEGISRKVQFLQQAIRGIDLE